MKPTDRVMDVDSTLAGEHVRMGIDQSALQHIISVLTDLYSDPELAVIREYSTNALDAHKDAGNPLPIEVTLPSPLAPFFRVRDYGDGLDVDDIRNIYSRYGTSTKRDSNDVVGMLGLGCKSALTYSDQFTLVATKNGRTVQVSIHRDEDGGGSMTIVSDEPTPDAANGVEVVVPAKRDSAFATKAAEFFRFWTPGTVLVNGEAPANIRDDANLTWLVPDKLAVLTASDRYDVTDAGWVVMGNVAYPIPSGETDRYARRKYSTVAFVEIGEVNFTPSREALQMTRVTKATLEQIEADTKRELTAAMQRTVTDAKTPHEAILAAQQAERIGVKIADLTYQGKPVPATLDRPLPMQGVNASLTQLREWLVVGSGPYARKSGETTRALPAYNSGRAYFVNFEAQAFSSAKRDKLDAWLETSEGQAAFPNGSPSQLVCTDQLTKDERFWTSGSPVIDWTPIQAMKVQRTGTVGPAWKARPTGSYELEKGGHIEAGDIDCTVPLLYLHTHERAERQDRWSRKPARQYPDDAIVLIMPANRLDKFTRDFAHAMHWRDYVKKEATAWLDQQDAAQLEAAKYQLSQQGRALKGLDPTRIDDPDLARAVITQNVKCAAVLAGIEQRRSYLADEFDRYALQAKYPDPLKQYPLISNGGSGTKIAEHVYLYVNAAFAASHPAKEIAS